MKSNISVLLNQLKPEQRIRAEGRITYLLESQLSTEPELLLSIFDMLSSENKGKAIAAIQRLQEEQETETRTSFLFPWGYNGTEMD